MISNQIYFISLLYLLCFKFMKYIVNVQLSNLIKKTFFYDPSRQHLGKCSRANNCWNTDLVAASKAKQTRPPKVKWVKGMEGVKKGGPQSHRLAEQQSRYRWSLIRRKSVWPPP